MSVMMVHRCFGCRVFVPVSRIYCDGCAPAPGPATESVKAAVLDGVHELSQTDWSDTGSLASRLDMAGRQQLVEVILQAHQSTQDWVFDKGWPGEELGTWRCGELRRKKPCRKKVARLLVGEEDEDGRTICRLIVGNRSPRITELELDGGAWAVTADELRVLSKSLSKPQRLDRPPRTAMMATAMLDDGEERIFFAVLPRGWGGNHNRIDDQEHDERIHVIWDAADDERVKMIHGMGWCPEGHGPFQFGPDEVNAAIANPNNRLPIRKAHT